MLDKIKSTICYLFGHKELIMIHRTLKHDVFICPRCGKQIFKAKPRSRKETEYEN